MPEGAALGARGHAVVLERIAAMRAEQGEAFAARLLVLPDFHGNRSPLADPHALGVISGLDLDASLDALGRLYFATAQGIAFGTRHILDALNAEGYAIDRLHVAGGHTRNPLLMELYADATGCTVVAPPEGTDAVLLGTRWSLRRRPECMKISAPQRAPWRSPARPAAPMPPGVRPTTGATGRFSRCTSSGGHSTDFSARGPDAAGGPARSRASRRCRDADEAPRCPNDERQLRRRDLAARAAWLYYVAGNTQDQLASKLNVSRQAAQRLVASAFADGLITFRIDHPIRACIELEEVLRARFALNYAEVVPGDADQDGVLGLGGAAARQLEAHLSTKVPIVLALGTGRTLRAAVGQVEPMERPQHKVVSLVGTTTRDGRASAFDVVMRLADRIGAACYPVPTTVVTDTVEERALLESQRPWQLIRSLADGASIAFVGIGTLDPQTEVPLLRDGFITETERDDLIRLGAVGDITGWAFDAGGRQIDGGSNARLTAIPHRLPLRAPHDRRRRRRQQGPGDRGGPARVPRVGPDH